MNSIVSELLACSPQGLREMNRARLRVAVAEELALRMEALGVTKAGLAEKLGVSRSAITQALSGDRNLSLNTLADVAQALKLNVRVYLEPKTAAVASTAVQVGPGAAARIFVANTSLGRTLVTTVPTSPPALRVLAS